MLCRPAASPLRTVAVPLLAAALGLVVVLAPDRASAQVGLRQPNFPPTGGWGRVLTVTDKWIVLENEQGQQFPVAFDSIGTFVMRWPSDVSRMRPDDLVEVNGIDLGSSRVQVNHIDLFKGSARGLVTPTYQVIIGYNRVLTPFDLEQQNTLGINMQYLLLPGEELMPRRLHIVGPPVGFGPLRVGTGGNLGVTVAPAGGLTVTQVTEGVPSYIRPGDAAYVVPIPARATPRSLGLAQLVIYKDVPLERFGR